MSSLLTSAHGVSVWGSDVACQCFDKRGGVVRWNGWLLSSWIDFERVLPAGPRRNVNLMWATTCGDLVVGLGNLRRDLSDDKS